MEEVLAVNRQKETPAWWEGTRYEDAKAIIRSNMASMARDSVAIGYYLRSIRDREQYREGGYQSFEDFVRAEYSMSYSAATRLIGLCERFSRDGNSPVLDDAYQGYSKSLLVEMLPMSDAQLDQVQPGMTVAEVREIKRAAQAEAVPEPGPELPAEEPEVVFQLAGAEDTSRQEVVERLEAVMPAPVFEEEDEEELLCDECANASALTGNPDSCANCGPEGRGYSPLRQEESAKVEETMPASVFEADEPHDGVWFARYLLDHYSLIERAPEVFANMERSASVLAKMLQMEIAPNGYSGFDRLGFSARFESYSAGVDCEVEGERHHWTYIQLIKDLQKALADVPKGQEESSGCTHDRAGACTEMVLSDPDVAQPCVEGPCPAEEPVATSQLPACIMGYAESGVCGAAAYCGQPHRCCLQCDEDCNGRCGWIPAAEPKSDPKVATSQNQEPAPKRNPAMENQAMRCMSNLMVEISGRAWPAALASARHLVHYLSLVVGEGEE